MKCSASEVTRLLQEHFPQAFEKQYDFHIEKIESQKARVRQRISDAQLRPGGTISGPTMMGLADFALYVAILGALGPVMLAVTTNLNINFLRKPLPADLIAEAEILKLGRRLAVGQVHIFSDGLDEPVAHASLTYSIPPK